MMNGLTHKDVENTIAKSVRLAAKTGKPIITASQQKREKRPYHLPTEVHRTKTIDQMCITVRGRVDQQSANILREIGIEHAAIIAGVAIEVGEKRKRKEWTVPTYGERATAEQMLNRAKYYRLDKKDRRALRSLIKCEAYGVGLPPTHRDRYNKLISPDDSTFKREYTGKW